MEKNQKPSEFEMDEKGLKKLAVLLRELRGTKSYEEVSLDTGIIVTNIKRLESLQVRKPNMYILKKLANYYGENPFEFYSLMDLYTEEDFEKYRDSFYYEIDLSTNPKNLIYQIVLDFKKIEKKKLRKVIDVEDLSILKNIKCCYNYEANPSSVEVFYISDSNRGFSIEEVIKYMKKYDIESIPLLYKTSIAVSPSNRNSLGDHEVLVSEIDNPTGGKLLLIEQFHVMRYEFNREDKEDFFENSLIESGTILGMEILNIKL